MNREVPYSNGSSVQNHTILGWTEGAIKPLKVYL